MTTDEILAMAKATAESMVRRAVDGYVKSCEKYITSYTEEGCLPDQDDFFAWLEGFDWEEPK